MQSDDCFLFFLKLIDIITNDIKMRAHIDPAWLKISCHTTLGETISKNQSCELVNPDQCYAS